MKSTDEPKPAKRAKLVHLSDQTGLDRVKLQSQQIADFKDNEDAQEEKHFVEAGDNKESNRVHTAVGTYEAIVDLTTINESDINSAGNSKDNAISID